MTSAPPRSRRYLTSCDIGEILRLSPPAVQGMLASGEIPSTRDNGQYRVDEEAFRRYLRAHTVTGRRPQRAGIPAGVEQAALVMLRLVWGDAYRDFRVEGTKWAADSLDGTRTITEASPEALNVAFRADWARQVMA